MHTSLFEQLMKQQAVRARRKIIKKLAIAIFKSVILAFILGTIWILFFFVTGGLIHATWNCALAGWYFMNRF